MVDEPVVVEDPVVVEEPPVLAPVDAASLGQDAALGSVTLTLYSEGVSMVLSTEEGH